MAHHTRNLVTSLIRRLQSAQIASLKSSLLLILARLVHMSVPHVEQFIDLLVSVVSVPAEGHRNSFAYLMFEWTRQLGEVRGGYEIKVMTTALDLLLLTRDIEMGNINVPGHLIKSGSGITTRSEAKKTLDQWTVMPLPAKILALFADTILEIKEQMDSNWEEFRNEGGAEDRSLSTVGATSNDGPTYEYLEAIAKALDEDQEDYSDDLHVETGSLNEINLVNFLVESLGKFSGSDVEFLEHFIQSLTKPQQNAIRLVMRGGI